MNFPGRVAAFAAGTFLFCAANANAADFGYERLALVVADKVGPQYSAFVPFLSLPDPSNDAQRFQRGYLGSVWRFREAKATGKVLGKTKTGNLLFHGADYCNPQDVNFPSPQEGGQVKNDVYRFEISGTLDLTIGTVFKMTALDAKYIQYFTVDITHVASYGVPIPEINKRKTQARQSSECKLPNVLKNIMVGDVTLKVYLIRSLNAGKIEIAKTILGTQIAANLGLKLEEKVGDSEGNPVLTFTGGQKIFAAIAPKE